MISNYCMDKQMFFKTNYEALSLLFIKIEIRKKFKGFLKKIRD